ncbi:hypothetical protein EDC32_10399 [Laceyella sacchari]|nr:hypothetical protein EDC32_10399 [Laceyella sacchari]
MFCISKFLKLALSNEHTYFKGTPYFSDKQVDSLFNTSDLLIPENSYDMDHGSKMRSYIFPPSKNEGFKSLDEGQHVHRKQPPWRTSG